MAISPETSSKNGDVERVALRRIIVKSEALARDILEQVRYPGFLRIRRISQNEAPVRDILEK